MSEQNQNGLNSQARSELFPRTMQANLRGAIKGDNEGQAWFYRRYATPIYCFLKKRGLAPEEAKDLTQDIIVKFLDNKFKNSSSFLLSLTMKFIYSSMGYTCYTN